MKHARTSAYSALTLSLLSVSGAALAEGTSAGSIITNTATATYDDAGTTRSVQSNTTTLKVDEVLDVTTSSLATGSTDVTATTAAIPFRVTNTGNGDESFYLTATSAVTGNGFDATLEGIALDSNNNGVYDPGVDQLLAGGAATPSLAADAGLTTFVLVSMPSGTADGTTGQVRLTATAVTGSGAPGTLFAGSGVGGGDAVVGLTTAAANDLAAVVSKSAAVSLTKSAVVQDPFGTARPVPGATVTYSLLAQVNGSGSLPNLRITDAIPAGTTYKGGTLTLGGAPLSDAADADAGAASAAGIDVALGSVPAGEARTVTFAVTID